MRDMRITDGILISKSSSCSFVAEPQTTSETGESSLQNTTSPVTYSSSHEASCLAQIAKQETPFPPW